MAKIQLKSDKITPFGSLYLIFKQFTLSGLRNTINTYLGTRSTAPRTFSQSDVFTYVFGNYLYGGSCIEDVMDIKPFWNGKDGMRIASSNTIARTMKKFAKKNVTYTNKGGKNNYKTYNFKDIKVIIDNLISGCRTKNGV